MTVVAEWLTCIGFEQIQHRALRAFSPPHRTAEILEAAYSSGAEFIVENPVDYGDRTTRHFIDERHAPLWLHSAPASGAAGPTTVKPIGLTTVGFRMYKCSFETLDNN